MLDADHRKASSVEFRDIVMRGKYSIFTLIRGTKAADRYIPIVDGLAYSLFS